MTAITRDLADRAEIITAMNKYVSAVDNRHWTRLRDLFEDELEVDFRSFGISEVMRGADRWVTVLRATMDGFDGTRHMISNHDIQLDGDTAICVANMQARHLLHGPNGDESYTVGGQYTKHLQRGADQQWRIYKYRLDVAWSVGNRQLLVVAAKRAMPHSATVPNGDG